MKRAILLGHPVAHSLSPVFQQAAFDHEHLPVRYELSDVAPGSLATAIAALRADTDVIGANVTIPHKESIATLLDAVDDEATAVGAVNTIVRAGTRLIGRNTDVTGFRSALELLVDGRQPPRDVLLLGAGGGAHCRQAVPQDPGTPAIRESGRRNALPPDRRDRRKHRGRGRFIPGKIGRAHV